MRTICSFLLLTTIQLFAQTTHLVEVGGSTAGSTQPYYSPQHLTIDAGDIVVWNNVSGTHNVNGTTAIFPGNPESFSSGAPQSGLWTYEYTFQLPGSYQYHCTQIGHSATQHGTITVLDPSSVQEQNENLPVLLFPSPAIDVLTVDFGTQNIRLVEVIGLDGRLISSAPANGRSRLELPTTAMVTGQYYVRMTGENGLTITRPFRKE